MSPFSGTTVECLKEYSKKFRVKIEAAQKIAAAIKAPMNTVRGWLTTKKANPQGETFIRLCYFLEDEGFDVRELTAIKKLKPETYMLGRLLYQGKLILEEIQEKIGFPKREHVYGMLRGRENMGEKRLAKARELCRKYLSTEYRPVSDCQGIKDIEKNGQRQLVQNLIALIKACVPLAALVASDDFPIEERKLIRDKIGNEVFFEFSNNVFRIAGGETTRGLMKGGAILQ